MTAGEFRYDPHNGTWVNIVGHRQNRPNLPSTGCPFCVGGLEAPEPYDTRWFVNRWPALQPGAAVDPAALLDAGITTFPAVGDAEVLLYSPVHDGSLGSLGVPQIRKVVEMWAARTGALMARPEVRYVLVFESRGTAVGATIHHPHGQLYAYPFIPPSPAAELAQVRAHGDVVAAELDAEVADGARLVYDDGEWAAWVPRASGYPYGLRLAPRTPVRRLDHLDDAMRDGLAAALGDVLCRYDRLWEGRPGASEIFPYLMWFHQAGRLADGTDDELSHLHLHLAPPQRAPGLARFIAAGEVGSGTMSNPVVPEAAAEALRNA